MTNSIMNKININKILFIICYCYCSIFNKKKHVKKNIKKKIMRRECE